MNKKCYNCKWYRDFPKQCRRVLSNFFYRDSDTEACDKYDPDKTFKEND